MKKFWFWLGATGAAGGVVSWLYSMTVGTPLRSSVLIALGASVVFGATAAFFGAFLANTAPEPASRALLFALLCGFAWHPVLDAGRAYAARLPEAKVERQAAQGEEALDHAIQVLANAGPEARKPAADQVLQSASRLAATAGKLKNLDTRRRFEEKILATQRIIRDADLAPSESVASSTSQLATEAALAGFPMVAVGALEHLQQQSMQLHQPSPAPPIGLDSLVVDTEVRLRSIAKSRDDRALALALSRIEQPRRQPAP